MGSAGIPGGKERWEAACERFLAPWRRRPYVLGALVSGSRVTGTADRFSDIDVHIVMSNRVKWRERGNRIVGGFMVEYFANPVRMYRKYYASGLDGGSRSIARMFARGRVVFDRDGTLKRLRRWGARALGRNMKRPGRDFSEPAKYHLWDCADGLASLRDRRSPGFWYAYYLGLDQLIESYRKFLGAETPAVTKMWDFFHRRDFRRAYGIRGFPDRPFMRMAARCCAVRHVAAADRSLRRLVSHVQRRMGGFRIDGWRYRSKAA